VLFYGSMHHEQAADAQPSMAGLAHQTDAECPFFAPHGYGCGTSSKARFPAVLDSRMAVVRWVSVTNNAFTDGDNNCIACEVTMMSQQEEAHSCTIGLNLRL
jgi:hypothetical protein